MKSRRTFSAGRLLLLSVVTSLSVFAPGAHAGVYATPAQRAADWLEAQQDKSDGSWKDPSFSKTYLQTAEAVLALNQLDRRKVAYYAGQSWVENHDPENLDARSRRLFVLRATQSSAQQDIDSLLTAMTTPATNQNGWGLEGIYQTSPLDTALALDALRASGASFNSASVIAYLKATQLTTSNDMGWPVAAGSITDVYTTARVVQALSAYKATDSTLTTPLANAVATLKTKVTTSSPAHLRAITALAYLRMDITSTDAKTLLNSLTSLQRADGGFDAGILATALTTQAYAAAEGLDNVVKRLRVDIPDVALRSAINVALGRGALDQLNQGEVAQLTTLNITGTGVSSLQGLQYATNLTSLYAADNNISDLSPIAGLPLLATKDFTGDPCPNCPIEDTDVPIPAWALLALGGSLLTSMRKKLSARHVQIARS